MLLSKRAGLFGMKRKPDSVNIVETQERLILSNPQEDVYWTRQLEQDHYGTPSQTFEIWSSQKVICYHRGDAVYFLDINTGDDTVDSKFCSRFLRRTIVL